MAFACLAGASAATSAEKAEHLFADLNLLTPEKPAAAGREPLAKQDRNRFDNLGSCIKAVGVPTKSAVGQMFPREATAEEKAAYAKLQQQGNGKDTSRLNWPKIRYTGLQQKAKEKTSRGK